MKKKNWIILGVCVALVLVFVLPSFIYQEEIDKYNYILDDACYVDKVETAHVGLPWVYVTSYGKTDGGKISYETYKVSGEELCVVYIQDVFSKIAKYTSVYDKGNVVENPIAVFKVKYSADQKTSLYEQADAAYEEYMQKGKYELLEHSYLPPQEDDYATWEEVYAYYEMTINPELDLEDIFFPESEWDKEAFRFLLSDTETKNITEVVYFERTDGIYCVEMSYPDEEEVREQLYIDFRNIDILADSRPLDEMRSNLKITETRGEDGSLTVTAVNNSDYTIPNLHCGINISYGKKIDGYDGTYCDSDLDTVKDVKSGEEKRFFFTAEEMEHCDTYLLDVGIWENSRRVTEAVGAD